ncbi:MAG: nucleotidyltransferase family protein [Bacteroidota bacterium]
MTYPISILVLAAGKASRMGQPKQLLPYGDTTLLGHCIQTALTCPVQGVYPIIGAYANRIQAEIQVDGIHWLLNPHWEEGLSSSIRQGISYLLEEQPSIEAALVLLGDQPLITVQDLRPFFDSFAQEPERMVSTAYGEKYGVPALFPRKYFQDLLLLKGDRGAGKWMASQADIKRISLSTTFDVDTQEDYDMLL